MIVAECFHFHPSIYFVSFPFFLLIFLPEFFDVNFCLRILSFASLMLLTQSVLFEQFMIFLKKSFRKKKIFYMESLSLNIILQAGNYMVFGQEITRQIGLKFQGYARKNVKGVMRYFRKEIYAWYYLRWPIHKKKKKKMYSVKKGHLHLKII